MQDDQYNKLKKLFKTLDDLALQSANAALAIKLKAICRKKNFLSFPVP